VNGLMTRPPGAAKAPHRGVHRRRPWVTVIFSIVTALVLAGGLVWKLVSPASTRACSTTLKPLAAKQIGRLQAFNSWLVRNHAQGYVGEVGWPGNGGDADQWNSLASAWYTEADKDQMWVTAWSAAQGWPATYSMALYRLSANPTRASAAGPQAKVVEAHTDPGSALRGVNDPTGAFGTIHTATGKFSDLEPGTYGTDYYYPTAPEYKYLASRGVRIVRLAFMWERIQPKPGAPLNATELHRLRQTVHDASGAGISVVLDLHNSGGFWHADRLADYPVRRALGSASLPTTALADLWSRLASAFRGAQGIAAYDLMNEPGDLATTPQAGARIWERASQQAVDAIRATGDVRTVAVEAYGPSGPEQFVDLDPKAWIHDPKSAVRYEMHQYFDHDGSGHYRLTLPAETQIARAEQRTGHVKDLATNLSCIRM
jgi:hypothetical protein